MPTSTTPPIGLRPAVDSAIGPTDPPVGANRGGGGDEGTSPTVPAVPPFAAENGGDGGEEGASPAGSEPANVNDKDHNDNEGEDQGSRKVAGALSEEDKQHNKVIGPDPAHDKNHKKGKDAERKKFTSPLKLSKEEKEHKKAIVRGILDEMEGATLPHGWMAKRLREDATCLKLGVNRQAIWSEERRRKRKRDSPEKASKTATEPSEESKSANNDNEGQQNDEDNNRASSGLGGSGEEAHSSPKPKKRRKSLYYKKKEKKKLPRRRHTFGSGEKKPPEFVEAWNRLDRAEAAREELQASVEGKRQRVEELQRQLEEAKGGLEAAAHRLRDYDETVVQPAKEKIIEVEMEMKTPFMVNYQRLVQYKEQHGSLKSLPSRCPDNPDLDTLCTWVSRQRKRGNLARVGKIKLRRPYEIKMLEDIGFEWDMKDKFDDHFNDLVTYKLHHGHCLVPQKYEDQKLAQWVTFLRQEMLLVKRDGKTRPVITPERIEKLDALGFVWSVFDLKWNKMYDKLKEFHLQHGHCSVMMEDQPDLATWAARQREEYLVYQDPVERKKNRKCKMHKEKIEKLNTLGFDWITNLPALPVLPKDDNEGVTTTATEAVELSAATDLLPKDDNEEGVTTAATEAVELSAALDSNPCAPDLETEVRL